MMRKQNECLHILIVLGFLVMILPACKEKGYPRPEHLIGEKKMVNILYDLHLSEALLERFRYNDPDSLKLNINDLYRSVLNKYHIEDSVLAKSIIYYSSYPKVYERIYAKVIDRMNLEQEEMNKQDEVKVKKE